MKEIGGEKLRKRGTVINYGDDNVSKVDCVLIFFSFLPNESTSTRFGWSGFMEQFESAKMMWRSKIASERPDLPCILVGTGSDNMDPLYFQANRPSDTENMMETNASEFNF